MAGYTKLFSSIIASTIWREPYPTKIVWITMLAMSDKNGIVEASIPGLADIARVPLPECETALASLSSPDRYSRTKEHQGRRIEPVDGGWRLLNHGKYRQKLGADERREYLRIKQAERRACQLGVNNRQQSSTMSTHAEADASPEADPDPNIIKPPRAPRAEYPPSFAEFWKAYPRKVGKGDAAKAWKTLNPDIQAVLAALSWQIKRPEWSRDAGQFVPHPATWLRGHRWLDENPVPLKPVTPPRAKGQAMIDGKLTWVDASGNPL